MNPPGGAFAPNETKIPNFTLHQKTFKNFQTMPEKSYLKKNTFKIFFLNFQLHRASLESENVVIFYKIRSKLRMSTCAFSDPKMFFEVASDTQEQLALESISTFFSVGCNNSLNGKIPFTSMVKIGKKSRNSGYF